MVTKKVEVKKVVKPVVIKEPTLSKGKSIAEEGKKSKEAQKIS